MHKKIKPNDSKKISFFSKLAILLAPIDEKILHSGRELAGELTDTDKEPARRRRQFPQIRPMQVIKI